MKARRSIRQRFLPFGVLVVGGLVAVATAFTTAGPAARSASDTLVVNVNTGPATLDPRDMTSLFDTIGLNFYVRLVQYGSQPGGNNTQQIDAKKMEPYLAKSISISNGGKTYTFKLRTGLKFPSGRPVDANAVKCSWDRSLKGIGVYFIQDGIPGNIVSYKAVNATTFQVDLKQADPAALQGWAQPAASVVDCQAVAGQDDKWLATHEAGSGPYQMVSYEPNKQLVLQARAGYNAWAGKEKLPTAKTGKIVINFVNADSTLLLQARSGAADITWGMSKQATASLKSNSAVKIGTYPTTIQEQMLLPWNREPWGNAKFREGITYAVPYQQILDKVAYGYGKLFFGPLPPTMQFFSDRLSKPRAFDLKKAKQLIDASGVKLPVSVTLTIDEGNSIHAQIATLLQSVWKSLGVNLTVQPLPPADYAGAMFGGKVQSAMRYDGPGVIDAGYYLGYDMRTDVIGIGKNINFMSIPAADKLLDKARKTLNPVTRQKFYNQITQLWTAASPKIVFYNDVATIVISKKVKSYTYFHEPDMRSWSK